MNYYRGLLRAIEMKKKSPECGKNIRFEFNACPICIEPLIDVAERSELPKKLKYL